MARNKVVICSKFITFAVTKTTRAAWYSRCRRLWFAQNSLPLRWQRQHPLICLLFQVVVICSKFITFAVTKTTCTLWFCFFMLLWFAQNSLPLRWQRQLAFFYGILGRCCDLLKIHYLCGDKDNKFHNYSLLEGVVICSKFITFAVTKTTCASIFWNVRKLWFAQNSLPLRWQRQLSLANVADCDSCDLLKIHYLCGDKDNW